MGFRRLNKFVVAGIALLGLALPTHAQPTPGSVPTTQFDNDLVVTGNLWPEGNVNITGNLVVGGSQTITGGTVFTGAIQAPSLILTDSGTHTVTLQEPSSLAANRILNVPLLTATSTIDVLELAQTISAVKTFSAIPLLPLGGETFIGTTHNTTLLALNAMGQATVVTIPDPGASTANVVLDAGTATIGGAKTFSTPLAVASVNHAIKSKVLIAKVCPAGGAAAVDGTTYFAFLYPGRQCTVTQITYGTHVDPVSGTNTLKVLKAAANGNTMLNAATISLNGTAIDTDVLATKTATGADLALTASQGIYCEYTAGTQGAAAKDVTIVVEVEFTDY